MSAAWQGGEKTPWETPVPEAVVNDFAGMLPPARWTSTVLQAGEAMGHRGPKGTPRYMTFRREESGWVYAGILPYGMSRHPAILRRVVRLQCGCCGASTWGRQHWNIDDGYGLCPDCIPLVERSPGELAGYGIHGIHFGANLIPEDER